MRTVHFTELRSMKVTGQIERGMRYLRCHDSRHAPYNLFGGAYSEEILTMGHIIPSGEKGFAREDSYAFRYMSTGPLESWMGKRRISRAFAADCGIESFPGAYGNTSNFLLDIAALRREGILVDTTPIARDPRLPRLRDSFEDDYYYEDSYYGSTY